MDRISRAHRSWNMARITARNTRPELAVRSLLHRLGLRFRLHCADLPGRPDIVLPRWNTVVLVNGCFWHRHANCRFAYTPKSRVAFWSNKFAMNVQRDRKVREQLLQAGWRVITVWECETSCPGKLSARLGRLFRK
ncbi:MAG: DNA mismatch endonuclease Vsr [Candidatus Korobacteraceae bacterium]|jgi:DNA mismatch endonuclease (patch repair protein)